MKKTIYELDLHEYTELRGSNWEFDYIVTRVPWGWLYKGYRCEQEVFVPFNDEFLTPKN